MTPIELDLDGPEARVPTRLVDRPKRKDALPPSSFHANGGVLFLVGPYSVTRGLVRAPGAWIVEACDPNGQEVLLQLAHLRPLVNDAERALRMHLEQTVLLRTTALLEEQDRVVLAHGGVDRVDGTRVLFWAMPVPERVHRLGNPLKHLTGLDHLLGAGLELAQRLARRHELGRFEPLLSEHLSLITDAGAELIGVPVQVPVEWLASDMPSPRLAPEEVAHGGLTALGDVWRLGQALSVLACAFEPLPEEVRALLERMSSTNPSARPPRASEIAVELESVRQRLEGTAQASEATPTTAMTLALSQDQVTELMMRAMGESTHIEAEVPMLVVNAHVPAWAFFFESDDYERFEEILAREHPDGLSEAQRADLARLCRGQASDRWPALVRTFFSHDDSTLFGDGMPEPTIAEAPMSFDEPTLIPEATILDLPLDPAEMAETKAVSPLVYVPDWMPPVKREESSVEIPALEPEPIREVEPAGRRSRKRWVLGALGGLALLGAAALAAGRPGDASIPIDLDRAVVIETGTPNAIILGEDGTVLGAGPVAISRPELGDVAVLVTAEGHRPERILLPSGGKLRVSLDPLPEGAKSESPRVDAPAKVQVALTVTGAGEVLLDGAPIEGGRAEIGAGFHRITTEGRERWIPMFRSVELRL